MSHVTMRSGEIQRYSANERTHHWITAILFILLAASGLAFFHPAFWPLTALLGGGSWARILHPFLGVLMFVSFFLLALRVWGDNKIEAHDREWNKRLGDVINNRDDNLPEIGKYNMGQKQLFRVLVVSIIVLLISGVVLWRPYFAGAFPIDVVRLAALLHSLAGFVLILGIIVHIYAAIWVKGSIRAMTRGTVSHGWAQHHHPLWYRKMTGMTK